MQQDLLKVETQNKTETRFMNATKNEVRFIKKPKLARFVKAIKVGQDL